MGVPLLGKPEPEAKDEPVIRLLFCSSCSSVDTLPPHEGRPEDDVVLDRLIHDLHTHPVLGAHKGLLFTVPLKWWAKESSRQQIIKQIREGLSDGMDELDPDYYAHRDQLRADAMACFNRHLRPKGQCPDYMSESKKILPPTKAERKDLGLASPKESGVAIYECAACPVHVYNITKTREQRGMYG